MSLGRGIGFLVIVGAVWGAAGDGLWWGWAIVAATAFGILVVVHRELVARRETLARAVAYHQRGLQRLRFDWKSGDPGQRHRDDNHSYSSDLDLFGDGSLFQFLCQAGTQAGRDCLSHWLEHPATAEDIRLRQAAVRDLLERCAIGLVSTHDQAFAAFADSLAPSIQNVHFADYIRDRAIAFDYRLRPGAVQHSNALELMRSIGIEP